MALGKRGGSVLGLGSGAVRYTRSMSGKRIAISSNMDVDYHMETKLLSNEKVDTKIQLEALPQDILNFSNVGPSDDVEEIETPGAPIISRIPQSRLTKKNLASISKTLFA